MKKLLGCSVCLLVLAACVPAMATSTLFSDLGPGNSYDPVGGWIVSGSGTIGTSFTVANLFTVNGIGSVSVSQIGLAVGYQTGTNAIYASIWTDNAGFPGSMVAGALWQNLSSAQPFGGCCGLVTISGISGVTLTGGQSYFMIVGPMSLTSTTLDGWNFNDQGINGLEMFSTDGGMNWHSNGNAPLGAFEVLSGSGSAVPEPASLFLLGFGVLAATGTLRRKLNR